MSDKTTTFNYSHDVNMEFNQDVWTASIGLKLAMEGYAPVGGNLSYNEEENTMDLSVECVRQPSE